jgi:DHA1 family bicyclomycin/chloramphenicol resistance-like MFS transporter
MRAYGRAVVDPAFVAICFAVAFGAGGFLLYVATAPDVALNILGLSSTQFGWLFIPIVGGFMLGSAASARAAGVVSVPRLLLCGLAFMLLGAAANLVVNASLTPRVPWAVLPLMFYTFGFSLLAPVVTIQALDLFPDRKGLAASLQGFIQILMFALIAGVVARWVYRSGVKHAIALAILLGLGAACYGIYLVCLRARNPQVSSG